MSPKTTCVPAGDESAVGLAGRHGRGGAVDGVRWSRASSTGSRASSTWKTTVNEPSGRSPKCSLEHVAHPLGVGAGHGERVREERREPRAREHARDEHGEPEQQHRKAVAENEARPALHGRKRRRGGYRCRAWPAATSRSCTNELEELFADTLARAAVPRLSAGLPAERRQLPHRRSARADRGGRASGRRSGEHRARRRRADARDRGERSRPEAAGRVYQQMEIEYGPFQRQVRLPEDVDPEQAHAEYERGILRDLAARVGRAGAAAAA